jgi:hypothetical protein
VCIGIDGCFAAAAGNATPPRSVRYYLPLSSCEIPGFDPTVLTSVKNLVQVGRWTRCCSSDSEAGVFEAWLHRGH